MDKSNKNVSKQNKPQESGKEIEKIIYRRK